MGDAAALYDFGVVIVFAVAVALSFLAYQLSRAIVGAIDVQIPVINVRPFHSIAVGLENSIVSWLSSAYKASEKQLVKGLYGLLDALAVVVGLAVLIGEGVVAALTFLWTRALIPYVRNTFTAWINMATEAWAVARHVAGDIADAVADAEGYARARAADAVASSAAFTVQRVAAAEAGIRADLTTAITDLRHEVSGAVATAEGYASSAVADLRRAEDAALSAAERASGAALSAAVGDLHSLVSTVSQQASAALHAVEADLGNAITAGDAAAAAALAAVAEGLRAAVAHAEQAAASALSDATGSLTATIRSGEAAATAALGAAQTALTGAIDTSAARASAALADAAAGLTTALNGVKDLAHATAAELAAAEGAVAGELPQLPSLDWDRLRDLLNGQDLAALAGLLAAIPLLRALTNSLATEAGLGTAECRGKVKGICSTDPNRWEGLLAGLVPLGFAFSLEQMVEVARAVAGEVEPLIAAAR